MSASWEIEKTAIIRQPVTVVYHYLSHFDCIQEWDPGVLTARMTSPAKPAVGSRFILTLLFGFNRIPMTYEIVSMKPERELVLKGSGATFDAVDHIRFEDLSEDTRLIYRAEVMFHKPLRQGVDWLLERVFRHGCRKAVDRLQVMLSGSAKRPSLSPLARLADQAVIPGLVGFTRLGYIAGKKHLPVASVLYAGRTVVLTGGTSGIGRAAARDLYRKGAHLIVVGRDEDKLKRLQWELKEDGGGGRIETEVADLSHLAEVRRLAERLGRRFGHIDVLINNAGALFNRFRKTREGIERTLATDLLSPYLLTRLLMPALSAAPDARVVNVASGGMYTQGVQKDFLQSVPENYDGPSAYAQAKRGLVALTEWWAREFAPLGISVHAMHPGWVDTPGLQKALPAFRNYLRPLLRSPAQGADTIVWLAAAPDAARASGRFWLDRKIRATHVFPRTRLSAAERGDLVRVLEGLCQSQN